MHIDKRWTVDPGNWRDYHEPGVNLVTTLQRLAPGDSAGANTALRLDGAVVIEGLLGSESLERLNGEIDPHVLNRPPGFRPEFDASFYGKNTTRIQSLSVKSPTFISHCLLDPTLLGICDLVLDEYCGDYWMSQAETIFIGPGEPAQQLHRDDENWSQAQKIGIDLQVSVLFALGDFDAEVGATQVIPGSHNWPLDQPFDPGQAITAELAPGDALVYLGSVVHGGGANRTSERLRKALYIGYLVGWLTPEEAVALSLPIEVVEGIPDRARQLLGWSSINGNSGAKGTAAALRLWQVDPAELDRLGGLFTN